MIKGIINLSDIFPTTLAEVLNYMQKRYLEKREEERLGQAYFNALHEIYPDIANSVRGKSSDPFYATNLMDERMIKFFEFLSLYFD